MTRVTICDKCKTKEQVSYWACEQIELFGNRYDLCRECAEVVEQFITGVKE